MRCRLHSCAVQSPRPSLVVRAACTAGSISPRRARISPRTLRRQRFFALRERETGFFAHQRSARPGGQRQPKRRFSGDQAVRPASGLVAFMEQEIMPFADYILDLHSGGGMEPLHLACFSPSRRVKRAAQHRLKMAAATGIEHLVASSAKTGFGFCRPARCCPACFGARLRRHVPRRRRLNYCLMCAVSSSRKYAPR